MPINEQEMKVQKLNMIMKYKNLLSALLRNFADLLLFSRAYSCIEYKSYDLFQRIPNWVDMRQKKVNVIQYSIDFGFLVETKQQRKINANTNSIQKKQY